MSLIPWLRKTRSAYSRISHDDRTLVTWSADVSWLLTMTPRTRTVVTRSMSEHGGCGQADLPRLPRALMIVSLKTCSYPATFLRYSEIFVENGRFEPTPTLFGAPLRLTSSEFRRGLLLLLLECPDYRIILLFIIKIVHRVQVKRKQIQTEKKDTKIQTHT